MTTEVPMCVPEVSVALLLVGFIALIIVLAIALHRRP